MAEDLPAGHIESADQRLGAMADVFKLTPFGLAGLHGQTWGNALKRLDSRHFVNRQSQLSFFRTLAGGGVRGANVARLLFAVFIAFFGQPVADQMWLKVCLILKNARRTFARWSPQCLA
jgi:hypothetical protein